MYRYEMLLHMCCKPVNCRLYMLHDVVFVCHIRCDHIKRQLQCKATCLSLRDRSLQVLLIFVSPVSRNTITGSQSCISSSHSNNKQQLQAVSC